MFQKTSSALQILDLSSGHLKNALDHHLYISLTNECSLSVLCYDNILCYLSTAIAHGSINEIEANLKRYFTSEQFEQAFEHLQNSLDYALTVLNSSSDYLIIEGLEECRENLVNSSCLLPVIELIERKKLLSYLPTFVTNDWMHMIRQIQDLEQIDTPSSKIHHFEDQMNHLKEQLAFLNDLVNQVNTLPSFINESSSFITDQCCLRTYCQHAFNQRLTPLMDSPSSSRSSLDLERSPMTIFNRTMPGFIRNPVSSFLMPARPTTNEMICSSNNIYDENLSSDDEQSMSSKTGSMVVIREDEVWIYPAGVDVRRAKTHTKSFLRSQSLFNPTNGTRDSMRKLTRRKSLEENDYSRRDDEKYPAQLKKHKKGKG